MKGDSKSIPHIADGFRCQPPPEEPFVSFSHAVTWIAFGHSVRGPILSVFLGIGRERSSEKAGLDKQRDIAIATAVRRLIDFGIGQQITMHGKFFCDVLDDEIEILTQQIPAVRLADFRWFDMLDDSLHRGEGLAWAKNRRQPCYPVGDDRHFRFVTVNRADLMREFPIANSGEPVAPIPFADAERRNWIKEQVSMSADNAHKLFQENSRYDGTKQLEFRAEWKTVRQTKTGRPLNKVVK